MRLRDPEYIPLGGQFYHANASTRYHQSEYQIWNAQLNLFQTYDRGPQNLKVGNVTLTTPIWG